MSPTKLCTFKVSSDFQGEKLGEQLLKQVLWWSQENHYELAYVTAYPKHAELIHLLKAYGFDETGARLRGSLCLSDEFTTVP